MTIYPKVHALWAHAARRAQLTAKQLGWTAKLDKTPEHDHVEAVLEKALREQSRKTLEVLKQELLTVSAIRIEEGSLLVVSRGAMLSCVDILLTEAKKPQVSARRKKR